MDGTNQPDYDAETVLRLSRPKVSPNPPDRRYEDIPSAGLSLDAAKVWQRLELRSQPSNQVELVRASDVEGASIESGRFSAVVQELMVVGAVYKLSDLELAAFSQNQRVSGRFVRLCDDAGAGIYLRVRSTHEAYQAALASSELLGRQRAELEQSVGADEAQLARLNHELGDLLSPVAAIATLPEDLFGFTLRELDMLFFLVKHYTSHGGTKEEVLAHARRMNFPLGVIDFATTLEWHNASSRIQELMKLHEQHLVPWPEMVKKGFPMVHPRMLQRRLVARIKEVELQLKPLIEEIQRLTHFVMLIAETEPKVSTYEREPIPKAVQQEVWRRDGARCVQCQSQERLEYDHMIPVSKGGSNTARNIQLLCERCNRVKYNRI